MFCSSEEPHDTMPKLKGRAIEVRNIIPALKAIWQKYMNAEFKHHQAVLLGLASSARMDEILDLYRDDDVLPADIAAEFREVTFTYARAQAAAAAYYNKVENLLIFDITIKTHWVLHQGLNSAYLNPRWNWNFIGEDFMSKIKAILGPCCSGNDAAQATVKLMERYCHALHHQFSAFEQRVALES